MTRYKKWDRFFQSQSAPQAVRNRKKYFIDLVGNILNKKDNISVLNIASGPGRDILELFECYGTDKINIKCVELDKKAIEYSKLLLGERANLVEFFNINAVKFTTDEKFDLVWSAGLFDYFNDSIFIRLLTRFYHLLKPNSEMVIGNFSDNNPSKIYMELFGDWILNYRSKEKLTYLGAKVTNQENIKVGMEPNGVNLFLHLKN